MVPKMALFRGYGGLDVRFYVRDPEKAHPLAERRVLAYIFCVEIRPGPLAVASCKNTKKLTHFGAQSHACAETTRLGGS